MGVVGGMERLNMIEGDFSIGGGGKVCVDRYPGGSCDLFNRCLLVWGGGVLRMWTDTFR